MAWYPNANSFSRIIYEWLIIDFDATSWISYYILSDSPPCEPSTSAPVLQNKFTQRQALLYHSYRIPSLPKAQVKASSRRAGFFFLYLLKAAEMFNIIPNKHLSGGIVPESLKEKQGMILEKAKEVSTSKSWKTSRFVNTHADKNEQGWGKWLWRSHENRKRDHITLWLFQYVLTL